MTATILGFFASVKGFLAGALLLIIAFTGTIFKARLDGARLERAKIEKEEAKAVEQSKTIARKVKNNPSDKNREELSKW